MTIGVLITTAEAQFLASVRDKFRPDSCQYPTCASEFLAESYVEIDEARGVSHPEQGMAFLHSLRQIHHFRELGPAGAFAQGLV
jgi:hypothetical protein